MVRKSFYIIKTNAEYIQVEGKSHSSFILNVDPRRFHKHDHVDR